MPKAPDKLIVKQEMFSQKWSIEFLKAHESFVQKVRKGIYEAPKLTIDYGTDGPNPYGVGASSLSGDARRWWYSRKGYKGDTGDSPPDYKYTAEQGRIMENPVVNALREMGYTVSTQVEAKGKGSGGIADGILCLPGSDAPCEVFESKHLGQIRYLDMFYKPINKSDKSYFWQAQVYQFALDLNSSLFVITSQDASAVRKELTMKEAKLKKAAKVLPTDDDHDIVAKLKEIQKPNPKVFAFRLHRLPSGKMMEKRAKSMKDSLNDTTPPARELDPYKDWICRPEFCSHRVQCLLDGTEGKEIAKLPEVEVQQVWLT